MAKAGCAGTFDTLACLRAAPYDKFLAAVNSVPAFLSYNSVALSYLPRPDGKVLTQSPYVLAKAGKYTAVPMIIGDQEDEGTIFALFQPNITSSDKIVTYLGDLFFHGATKSQLETLVSLYSPWVWDGSPFRSGIFNEIYPGFKRLAAILGDLVFTLTRRVFLEDATANHPNVPAWSYLASYDQGTPILGTFHTSDILQVFYGILPNHASKSIQGYYANFVYNLDPNNAGGGTSQKSKIAEDWPQWSKDRLLINFFADSNGYLKDDFRSDAANFLAANVKAFYI